MTQSLPAHPSLENLKKRAKTFLKQCQAGNTQALARVRASHPQHTTATDDQLRDQLQLTDCQLVIAREFGHENWPAFSTAVNMANKELADQFLTAAILTYGDRCLMDIPRANEMLRENPQLASSNIWTAAAVGNVAAVESFLDSKPDLVNSKGGPFDQTPLLYLCYSRVTSDDANHDALATTKLLLDRGANANAHYFTHGTYKFTCVTGVIGEGENGVAKCPPHPQAMQVAILLLDGGADPNDSQGLYNSMFSGGTHWIKLLLDHGLHSEHPINWSEKDGTKMLDYLLSHACKKNMVDRVELLLQYGANANAMDWYDKRSCFECANEAGNTEIVRLLLAHGARVVEPKSDQQRFLNACMAADRQAVEVMQSEHPPGRIAKWVKHSDSHLSMAADVNKIEAAKLMLELGFPIGNALFDAAWHDRQDFAKMLIDHGASIRQRHQVHHATPIGFADHAGHYELRDYLLELDIDIFDAIRFDRPDRVESNLATDAGSLERTFGEYASRRAEQAKHTPLVAAVVSNRVEITRLLLEHGANRTVKHHDRRTLLQVALDNGNQAIAKMLEATS